VGQGKPGHEHPWTPHCLVPSCRPGSGKRGPDRQKFPFEKFKNELFPMIQKLRAEDGNLSGRKLWPQVRAMPGCDISYPAMMQMLKRRGIKFRRQPTADIWSMPNLK
jgi:hypothetical protein